MTDNNALAQEFQNAIKHLRIECNDQIRRINTGVGLKTPGFTDINRLLKRCDTVFAAADALRTPAPAPVGGDVAEALKDVLASLVAAHSLLARSPKTAASSDKMFDQMLKDYEKSIDRGRKAYAALQAQPAPEQDAVELARRIKRTAEMSANIMRDKKRTGGWEGAENTASAFDRLAKYAEELRAALAAMPPKVEADALPKDVVELVIAARELVFSDHRPVGSPETQAEIELIELFDNLDTATEKFSEMVRWDDEPDCDPIDDSETPSDDNQTGLPPADDTQAKVEAPAADEVREMVERLRLNDREIYLPLLGEAADMLERLHHQTADAVAAERERCEKIVVAHVKAVSATPAEKVTARNVVAAIRAGVEA